MLSTCTRIGNCTFTCKCLKRCKINSISYTTSLQATYSASIVNSVTHFCPRERQQTDTFIKYTIYPVTLIHVSLLPVKSASEYAFNSHCLLSLSSGFYFNLIFCVSNAYLITLHNSFICPSVALSITFDNSCVPLDKSGHECFTKYSSIQTPLLYNFVLPP